MSQNSVFSSEFLLNVELNLKSYQTKVTATCLSGINSTMFTVYFCVQTFLLDLLYFFCRSLPFSFDRQTMSQGIPIVNYSLVHFFYLSLAQDTSFPLLWSFLFSPPYFVVSLAFSCLFSSCLMTHLLSAILINATLSSQIYTSSIGFVSSV